VTTVTTTLPMFPLGAVLLPGAFLPLHVFEERYQALVQACLEGTPEFGVALIERGQEVGGGDVRFDIGCVARIVEAVELPQGTWAIGAVGARRIRVERWLADDPFPRAEVTEWPDPPPGEGATDSLPRLVAETRRVLALGAELGEAVAPMAIEVDDDPVLAGYQLGALAPLGPLDRLALLGAPSADERARRLTTMLADLTVVLEARLADG